MSCHVMSCQVRSGLVWSGQVRSHCIMSCNVTSPFPPGNILRRKADVDKFSKGDVAKAFAWTHHQSCFAVQVYRAQVCVRLLVVLFDSSVSLLLLLDRTCSRCTCFQTDIRPSPQRERRERDGETDMDREGGFQRWRISRRLCHRFTVDSLLTIGWQTASFSLSQLDVLSRTLRPTLHALAHLSAACW